MNQDGITYHRNKLKKYYLKITTLSPVHIGTDDVYEPTSFVMKNDKFYFFDEVLFYKALNDVDKNLLNTKLENWIGIIDFYKDRIEDAKRLSLFECEVSKSVIDRYSAKINKDGTKNYNKLQINTTYKNINNFRAIIPGSSIKGMLDTILKIYPPKSDNETRQHLLISDAFLLQGGTKIGYSYRKHKDLSKSVKSNIPQIIEIIKPKSEFVCTISSIHSFENIKKSVKEYYKQRDNDKKYYKEINNEFVARIGKYSGKEYMVDDGTNVLNSYDKPIATHMLYEDDSPFGWIQIEMIEENDYNGFTQIIKESEKKYFENIQNRYQNIRQNIVKQKQKAKEEAIKKQKLKEEEELRLKTEQEEKELQLKTMSPLEREIALLCEKNPTTPEITLIIKAIEDGEFNEFKCEALKIVREKMIEKNEWKEKSSAKRPQKDKLYQRTLRVLELLKVC